MKIIFVLFFVVAQVSAEERSLKTANKHYETRFISKSQNQETEGKIDESNKFSFFGAPTGNNLTGCLTVNNYQHRPDQSINYQLVEYYIQNTGYRYFYCKIEKK